MNSTWILALETSVTQATLALACGDTVVASRSFTSERSQECDLFPPLQELLAELPPEHHLSNVIIGTGPGSYNGARVGIAAAQAIALRHDCPVAGLCSFEAVPEVLESETVWAIGDARRGSFFIMPVVQGRAQTPPELLDEAEFLERLADFQGYRITFESPERLPAGTKAKQTRSTAQGLFQAWQDRTPAEQAALQAIPAEAFYLRPPHITKSTKSIVSFSPPKP